MAKPRPQSINNISKWFISKNAKDVSVTPIDKNADEKTIKFSSKKFFKLLLKSLRKYTKTQLTEKMNDIFSPFICAYRENLTIRLIE